MYFKYNNFFIVKKIEVAGLDERDNLLLEKKLKDLNGSNIFGCAKVDILNRGFSGYNSRMLLEVLPELLLELLLLLLLYVFTSVLQSISIDESFGCPRVLL